MPKCWKKNPDVLIFKKLSLCLLSIFSYRATARAIVIFRLRAKFINQQQQRNQIVRDKDTPKEKLNRNK